MRRLPDGTARTLFIAALTGGIFAAFLLVSPKLAALGDAAGPGVAAESVGASGVTTTTATTTTTTTVAAAEVAGTTTTSVPDPDPATPENGYDGSVTLGLSVTGPRTGQDASVLLDGDQITWRFEVTNTTDERLWGVFVWLELAGRAACDAHRLAPQHSTSCTIVTRADAGDQIAEAWVTAWTSTRQVKDRVFYRFRVLAP